MMYLTARDRQLIAVLFLSTLGAGLVLLAWWPDIAFITLSVTLWAVLVIGQIEIFRRTQREIRSGMNRYVVMDITDVIRTRHSVRKFSDDPVPQEHLLTMLEAAREAPSGGNLQPWHFVVIRDRNTLIKMENAIREKIRGVPDTLGPYLEGSGFTGEAMVKGWEAASLFFVGAPLTVAVLVEEGPNRYDRQLIPYFLDQGMDRYSAHKYLGFVEIQGVAAATENLLLAAHSLGYGACWMRIPFIAKDALRKVLEVGPTWDLAALVPIGRPAPGFKPSKVVRKAMEEIVTFR